jgi:hypothetical protein
VTKIRRITVKLFRSARWLLLALLVCLVPASSNAGIFISVNFGPPVLPVYEVPACPQPNLIWTPGYWAYGPDGYFWVPGAWVPAPFVGGLWTPGYWGWSSGLYVYNPGYWGYHVGYYGGVNYGGGYLGIGFAGGEWRGGGFAYNTAVVNVNTTIIHNTYINQTIVQQNTVANPNHVAYAGGPGGIQHVAAPQEKIAASETHTPPTTFQTQHINAAQADKTSYARVNGGKPANLAVAKPLPVETHPAPPAPKAAPSSSTGKNIPVANGSRSSTATGSGAPKLPPANTGLQANTNNGSRTVTPPKTTTPPKTYAAPKTNAPSKPPEKPKPEGHEKQ